MKTLKTLSGIILLLGLTFCSEPGSQHLKVNFNEVDGLKVQDKVLLRGVEIGEVSDISLQGDMVLVNLRIEDEIRIPVDSRIILKDVGITGNRAIAIENGISVEYIEGDAIMKGELYKPDIFLQDPGEIIKNISAPFDALDSMVIEMRRLNENIERMNK